MGKTKSLVRLEKGTWGEGFEKFSKPVCLVMKHDISNQGEVIFRVKLEARR